MKTSIRKRELISKIYEWLISLGQRIPGARKVWRARRFWGKPQGAGYVSVTKEVWESQYLNGDWIYLRQLEQLARYSVIVGYRQYFKHGCSILDVGCGEGILQEKLSAHGYSGHIEWPYGSMVNNFIAYSKVPLLIVQDLTTNDVPILADASVREYAGH